MTNLRHHSLVAWQRADDLCITLHKLTIDSFPPIERCPSPPPASRPALPALPAPRSPPRQRRVGHKRDLPARRLAHERELVDAVRLHLAVAHAREIATQVGER